MQFNLIYGLGYHTKFEWTNVMVTNVISVLKF